MREVGYWCDSLSLDSEADTPFRDRVFKKYLFKKMMSLCISKGFKCCLTRGPDKWPRLASQYGRRSWSVCRRLPRTWVVPISHAPAFRSCASYARRILWALRDLGSITIMSSFKACSIYRIGVLRSVRVALSPFGGMASRKKWLGIDHGSYHFDCYSLDCGSPAEQVVASWTVILKKPNAGLCESLQRSHHSQLWKSVTSLNCFTDWFFMRSRRNYSATIWMKTARQSG